MLSSFNLKDGAALDQFEVARSRFYAHLRDQDLLVSAGPLCQRSSQTPMDTDESRTHSLFFVTTFEDQHQCDSAYDYINQPGTNAASLHWDMMKHVRDDAVFSCWSESSARERD